MSDPVVGLVKQSLQDSPYEGYLLVPMVSVSQALEIMLYLEAADVCEPGEVKVIQYEAEGEPDCSDERRLLSRVDSVLGVGVVALGAYILASLLREWPGW